MNKKIRLWVVFVLMLAIFMGVPAVYAEEGGQGEFPYPLTAVVYEDVYTGIRIHGLAGNVFTRPCTYKEQEYTTVMDCLRTNNMMKQEGYSFLLNEQGKAFLEQQLKENFAFTFQRVLEKENKTIEAQYKLIEPDTIKACMSAIGEKYPLIGQSTANPPYSCCYKITVKNLKDENGWGPMNLDLELPYNHEKISALNHHVWREGVVFGTFGLDEDGKVKNKDIKFEEKATFAPESGNVEKIAVQIDLNHGPYFFMANTSMPMMNEMAPGTYDVPVSGRFYYPDNPAGYGTYSMAHNAIEPRAKVEVDQFGHSFVYPQFKPMPLGGQNGHLEHLYYYKAGQLTKQEPIDTYTDTVYDKLGQPQVKTYPKTFKIPLNESDGMLRLGVRVDAMKEGNDYMTPDMYYTMNFPGYGLPESDTVGGLRLQTLNLGDGTYYAGGIARDDIGNQVWSFADKIDWKIFEKSEKASTPAQNKTHVLFRQEGENLKLTYTFGTEDKPSYMTIPEGVKKLYVLPISADSLEDDYTWDANKGTGGKEIATIDLAGKTTQKELDVLENGQVTKKTWRVLEKVEFTVPLETYLTCKGVMALTDTTLLQIYNTQLEVPWNGRQNWTGLNRPNLYSVKRVYGIEDLQRAIEKAKAILREKYTEESQNTLKEAIEKAEALVKKGNITSEEAKQAEQALQQAIEGLQPKAPELDKAGLTALIQGAKALQPGNKTAAAYQTLQQAITAAQTTLDTATTQDELDRAKATLQEAINKFIDSPNAGGSQEPEDPVVGAYKDNLQQTLTQANALDTQDWKGSLAGDLRRAMHYGNQLLSLRKATQAQVDAADSLIQAILAAGVAQDAPGTNLDATALADGTYTVNAIVYQNHITDFPSYVEGTGSAYQNHRSMMNNAVQKPLDLVVNDGNYELHPRLLPLELRGRKGYVGWMKVEQDGTFEDIEVDSTYQVDELGKEHGLEAYVKDAHFAIAKPTAQDARTMEHVQVFVPVMESLQSGGGTKEAKLVLYWDTLRDPAAVSNKGPLADALHEVATADFSDGTPSQLKALERALYRAKQVLDQPQASDEDVKAAAQGVTAAVNRVGTTDVAPTVDFKVLQSALTAANVADVTHKTENSVQNFRAKKFHATFVMEKSGATQAEVNDAAKELYQAIADLKPESTGGGVAPAPNPGGVGQQTAYVEMWHAYENKYSMGNNAIDHNMVIEQAGGQTTYTLVTKPMQLKWGGHDFTGNLTNLFVYDNGAKRQATQNGNAFTFTLPGGPRAEIKVAVWVDAMDQIAGRGPGSGEQDAILRLTYRNTPTEPSKTLKPLGRASSSGASKKDEGRVDQNKASVTYEAPVTVRHAYESGKMSMANNAIDHTAKVVEQDGKAYYTLTFRPMQLQGMTGNVTNLFVYDGSTKVEASKSGNEFTFTRDRQKEKEIKIAVWVDAMDILAGGTEGSGAGEQDAYLVFDWDKAKEVSKTDAPITHHFTDVQNHWAGTAIAYVTQKGYFKGTSATTFSPEANTTRGQFVTVLGRMAGVQDTATGGSRFYDVPHDAYYAAHVQWAVNNGIVMGYEDGSFGPDRPINREEMAAILARYVKKMNRSKAEQVASVQFVDNAQMSSWAALEINQMARMGLVKGMPDGSFAPKAPFTRAQVAQVLYNLDH